MGYFRLPQQRDPNESVNRFVQTALAARHQDQTESFQMQKSLLDMEAQQKRKQLLNDAYGQSIQRVAKVLSSKGLTSSEVNAKIEGEASRFASSAPELYKALTSQKVKDAQHVITDKEIDKTTGQTIEKKYLLDEYSGVKKPLDEGRVVDQNTKVVTADTEVGKYVEKKAITLDAKGKKVAEQVIGKELSPSAKKELEEQGKPLEEKAAYRMLLEKKNTMSSRAIQAGKNKNDVQAQIENAVDGIFKYNNKYYKVGKDSEKLLEGFDTEIKQAQEKEKEYQLAIEHLKTIDVNKPEGKPTEKRMKYNPVTKQLESL